MVTDEREPDLFGDEGLPEVPEVRDAPSPSRPTERSPRVWTVSQVNRAVRSLLESAVDSLWVSGEVGGWTRSRAGHRYFTLKDERAQLRCILWRSDAERLPIDPQDGMRVRVFGSLTLYEGRGEYQMTVRVLEAEGADGLWRLAFEKLRGRLAEEGLLDPARKRRLPQFPSTVGVVTSTSGAAIHDILTVLRRRAPWIRVVVRGTRVQGEGASREIARSLDLLGRSGLCDVIIVGRGGGSTEDLWAFNEEPVARSIAECPVPVVSAVGHEGDVTIADLVADFRAATPSAAAEAVAPERAVVLEQLRRVPGRLARSLQGALFQRRENVREILRRMPRIVERRLAGPRQSVDRSATRLELATRRFIERRRARLGADAGKLQALSPLAILDRGYALARADDGSVLRHVADFPTGRRFALRVGDGSITCESRGAGGEER